MPAFPFRPARAALAAALCAAVALPVFAADEPVFNSVIDDSPITMKMRPNETITPAVEAFYTSAHDPYVGDEAALPEGKKLFGQWCASCHMPDGSGRMGPSLISDTHHYPRFTSDKGMFEIVYGGATGAMQGFGNRLTRDQILHIIAYVRSLKKA